MKKIAVILKGYPRSDEIFIVQELVELERQGFELKIYSLVKPADKVFQKVHSLLRAQVVYVPNKKSALKPFFWRTLWKRPLKVLETWSIYRSQALVESRTWKRFLQALWIVNHELEVAGVLYSHFANAPSEVAMGVAQLTGVPWFAFAHAKDIHQTPPEILSKRFENARQVFACNRESQKKLAHILGRAKLIYHGVNTEHLYPSEKKVGAHKISLYSAGRLVEKKGHDFILKVLAELKRMGKSFQFDLFGDGPLRSQLEKLVREYSLEEEVCFHGAYNLENMSSHVLRGSIYLGGFQVARDRDRDGLPNTLLEAMYLGAIPLCKDSEAISEVLLDGENGFLLNSDEYCWALKIIEVVGLNELEREKLISCAQRTVLEQFDFIHCCQELIAEFKSI